jgi:predicted nucleotidyltransferase
MVVERGERAATIERRRPHFVAQRRQTTLYGKGMGNVMSTKKAFRPFRIKGGDQQIRAHIKDLCEQIVAVAAPQKIILFGSYAYGEPNEDSDVDLLVIKPFTDSSHQQAVNIRMKIKPKLPLDLLVRTPEFIAQRLAMGDFFMQEVMQQGKVLYEANHAGMDRQSRRRLDQRTA